VPVVPVRPLHRVPFFDIIDTIENFFPLANSVRFPAPVSAPPAPSLFSRCPPVPPRQPAPPYVFCSAAPIARHCRDVRKSRYWRRRKVAVAPARRFSFFQTRNPRRRAPYGAPDLRVHWTPSPRAPHHCSIAHNAAAGAAVVAARNRRSHRPLFGRYLGNRPRTAALSRRRRRIVCRRPSPVRRTAPDARCGNVFRRRFFPRIRNIF